MAKTTVLIVEDEAIVAADLAGKLRQLEYEVVATAAEGEEAVEMACRMLPRVVLMDIRLQGSMDGIQAAEAIRGRVDLPVIYLTAHSDAATLERAKLSDPFGYILKPFEERELATAIEMALLKHDSDRQLRERAEQLKSANETLRASRVAALNLMEDAVIARREAEETNVKLRLEMAERERAVQAQRESELFYSQTLDSIPGMVFTTRPDGYCDFQSLQWVEFTGIPMSEHLGDGWNRLLHPDDRPRAFDAWRSAVEGRAPYDLEYRVRRHDGKYEWFKVIGRPICDASGKIVKWFGVAVNIDTNKQAEEELKIARESAEAASRAKSQFLANMSHELRTPMTGVLGMLDLTLGGALDAEQRDYLEAAHKSARALLHILNEILDLSSIESGKFSIEHKPFRLAKCLADSLEIFNTEARRKGLELISTLADDLPPSVVGDPLRLRQVLVNLIGNALKFTEQGRVEVTVTNGNRTPEGMGEFTFTVTDTGIGIPRDKRHLLFQSFSQVDDSHTRSYGGSGLGLAICHEIVTKMGGTIGCESEQGQGSSFFFTVPFGEAGALCEADEVEEMHRSMPGIALDPAESRKTRLLIAEDEPVIRQLLDVMLRLSNFEPDFAEDGQMAVEMWDQGEYDLVLMDVQMPRMDGFSATRAIRVREKERGGGRTLIVAMTAHAYREDENRCLDAGMDAFISKPIDLQKSVELINALISQRGGS